MGRFLDITEPTEPMRSAGKFHLADPDGDMEKAYSFVDGEQARDPALADVDSHLPLRFVPIDHNSAFENLEQKRHKRCDGLLRSEDDEGLVFVELKNRSVDNAKSVKSWISNAIKQLRQTVVLFRREEDVKSRLSENGFHLAYICNPKGPYEVPVSAASAKKVFLHATKNFVLRCTNKIVV